VGEYSAFFWFERERTVVGLLVCEECLTLLKPYKTDRRYRPMLNNNFSIIGYDYYEHEHGNDRLIHIILELVSKLFKLLLSMVYYGVS
jgi:hypothetical protein